LLANELFTRNTALECMGAPYQLLVDELRGEEDAYLAEEELRASAHCWATTLLHNYNLDTVKQLAICVFIIRFCDDTEVTTCDVNDGKATSFYILRALSTTSTPPYPSILGLYSNTLESRAPGGVLELLTNNIRNGPTVLVGEKEVEAISCLSSQIKYGPHG